ncbi:ATP-binding protein [Paenibacillus sp. CN-4]|uniref:ATP-binding protein n=1 Tax=Paenibacillus nanchangensis TaxID=3348343 RepID=UPI00397B7C26
MSRDFGAELDQLSKQLGDLQQLVNQLVADRTAKETQSQTAADKKSGKNGPHLDQLRHDLTDEFNKGGVYYSGEYRGEQWRYRWEPQARQVSQLLNLDGEKAAKVLTALGHRQRLDILRSVLNEPLTGAEIVERLNMGTTGQLYHHIKALLGADLLVQEERGGRYTIPSHRVLPLLLLLAAASDLLDTSDYMELTEARNNASAYLDTTQDGCDPHQLLWAVIENSILEHRAGFCSEVGIFLHQDGSITVSDNGRGIPVQVLPNTEKSSVQAVLTELGHNSTSDSFVAPGKEKGISIAVVNALCPKLSIEVRREGKVFRQDYRHGIPQSDLLTVGITNETGTSITFLPDQEIFRVPFDSKVIEDYAANLSEKYPDLTVHLS